MSRISPTNPAQTYNSRVAGTTGNRVTILFLFHCVIALRNRKKIETLSNASRSGVSMIISLMCSSGLGAAGAKCGDTKGAQGGTVSLLM